jgi:hypothetical protein
MNTNKSNFKWIVVLMAIMMTGFASCGKDDPNDDIELPEIDPVVASISAKWVNNDANSKYASFEFQTDGIYIVSEYITGQSLQTQPALKASSLQSVNLPLSPFYHVTNGTEPVLHAETRHLVTRVGKYTISGNVITLTDYGLIENFRASNDEFNFTFRPNGTLESIEFAGTRELSISESKRTVLMCRMWDIEDIQLEGGDYDGWGALIAVFLQAIIRTEVDGRQVSLCVMLSKSGTYLSIFRDDEGNYFTKIQSGFGGVSTVVGTWEWADREETRVNWTQTGSFDMDGGSGVFEIRELTLDRFVITGSSPDGTMSYIEKFNAANKF